MLTKHNRARASRLAQQAYTTWAAEFEKQCTTRRPDTAGRIDWHTARHLFNVGNTPGEAATRYLSTVAPNTTGRT